MSHIKTVRRYFCDFCTRHYGSRYAANRHEKTCWYNPAAKSCRTCANLAPLGYCRLGIWDPDDHLPAIHCPSWEPKISPKVTELEL